MCAPFGVALASPLPARAAVSAKDIQIAGRVLTFMSPSLAGNVRLGIVYDPDSAGSTADERALAAIIGNGLKIEGINLIAVPVPLASLSSAQVSVYFMTMDLGNGALKLGAQATLQKRVCITTDLSETQAGNCTVAVQSNPVVRITINKTTADAGGISFTTAFLLMISEI